MKFEGIIFDMDGTLVDSEIIWERAEREMFERRGLAYTDEVRQQVIGLRLDEFFRKLVEIFDLAESVDALMMELNAGLIRYLDLIEPKAGAQELIEYVASLDVPYAIASSSPLNLIHAVVEAQGWKRLIPNLYSAEVVPLGKPAPDVYLYACQQLGVQPQRSLALEDSPNGARAAVAAGMTCVAVPDFHSSPAKFAGITPHIFPSLHEVLAQLKVGGIG
jgi:beta-phosphoglucomutase-like phosphatase (HAD superfamily)